MYDLTCNLCHQQISPEKIVDRMAYCSCGNTVNLSRLRTDAGDKNVAKWIVGMTLMAVFTVIHYIQWDQHFLKVIPLKMRQMARVATVKDLNELAQICADRKKWECQGQALYDSYQVDSNQIEHLREIGFLQQKLNNHASAVLYFKKYLEAKPTENSLRQNYVVSLIKNKQWSEAKKQFELLLSLDQKVTQFQVARDYVEALIQNSEWDRAQQVIAKYRASSTTSSMFLEKEWKMIHNKSNGFSVASTKNKKQ